MHPFIDKYHQTHGTHCWFCDREFGKYKSRLNGWVLNRTREHIVPKSRMRGWSYSKNYIASCSDCNIMKGSRDAAEFAQYIENLMKTTTPANHNMNKYFPMMRKRSWKLYNKTRFFHQNHSTPSLFSKKK